MAEDNQWRVTDAFGNAWRFARAARLAAGTAVRSEPRSIRSLLYFAFAEDRVVEPELATKLAEVAAAVEGDALLGGVRLPLVKDRSLPTGFAARIGAALETHLEIGALSLEREDAPRLLFTDQGPPTDPSPPPVGPPLELSSFSVVVQDEAGVPIGGIDMLFDAQGKQQTVPTNAAGVARFDGVEATRASVRVASIAAVRKVVEPRWKTLRPEKLPEEGDDVTIQALRNEVFSVALEADTPHTLAIVPNHRRVRLVGMHFDTNKCFLLPSAVPGVRIVKLMYDEIDATRFLVVGHTDKTGAASYNEKLSLERAQAIADYLKNNVDGWMPFFAASKAEKRWGGREINAMLSVLPEGQKPFASGGTSHAADAKAVKAFQSFSNDTRGTSLPVNGVIDDDTRREIVTAYMALQDTTLPDGATITAHGCGANQPLPADKDGKQPTNADQRRVDMFAFDGPVRPPPPGSTSGPGAPEYDQWVDQMQTTRDVGTDVLTFAYAVDTGDAQQWSEAATISLVSEDAVDAQSFVLSNGKAAGSLRIFDFVGIRPGVRYRADINEGALEVALFDFTALHAVASETSDESQLALPEADPAAPFTPVEDVEDNGTLRVRLFGSGSALAHSLFRFDLGGSTFGFSEDGVASAPLPPACPVSCTLEWGEPGDDGTLPFRVEVALDCDAKEVGVSSMLHNLGYPKELALETRVRAFQDDNGLTEQGLSPAGEIPPATRDAIEKTYNAQLA